MSLQQLVTLLTHYNLRSFYDKRHQTQWFCAIDICAIVFDTHNYTQAKTHWKNAKRRLPRFDQSKGYAAIQLKLPARDGRFYLTDVLSLADALYLLKTVAQGKNTKNRSRCKQWLALLCPKTVLQALRERGSQGHFELVQALRGAGRLMTMVRIRTRDFVITSEGIEQSCAVA